MSPASSSRVSSTLAQSDAEHARERRDRGHREVHEETGLPDRCPDGLDESVERERLRTDSVDDVVRRAVREVDAKACDVVDVHGPDPVATVAHDREHWQMAQQPRDVVDQHVTRAEHDGRPNDREGDAALGKRFLHQRLAPEVAEIRSQRRVGDAHVHDLGDTGRRAAVKSARDCTTVSSNRVSPWTKRTQYVL